MPKWAWILIGTLVAFVLVVSSCSVGLFMGRGDFAFAARDTVAVIEVRGTIQGGSGGVFPSGTFSGEIVRQLQRAQEDESVKAIVLAIDSPGGGAAACDDIYHEIMRTLQIYSKPVVSSMGGMAASGGYYISAPCNRILANRSTLTGSIGVISITPNIEGLLEKIGVRTYVFKSGEHKDSSRGLRALTEEEEQMWQAIIDESYEQFLQIVIQGRSNLTEAEVRELADGRIFTGNQALQNGLIDELGDLDRAIDVAAALGGIEGEPRIEQYSSSGLLPSIFGSMAERFQKNTLQEFIGLEPHASLQYLYPGP